VYPAELADEAQVLPGATSDGYPGRNDGHDQRPMNENVRYGPLAQS